MAAASVAKAHEEGRQRMSTQWPIPAAVPSWRSAWAGVCP